jgi:hypothetical protein
MQVEQKTAVNQFCGHRSDLQNAFNKLAKHLFHVAYDLDFHSVCRASDWCLSSRRDTTPMMTSIIGALYANRRDAYCHRPVFDGTTIESPNHHCSSVLAVAGSVASSVGNAR